MTHAPRVFIFPRDTAKMSAKLASSTPNPLVTPGHIDPGSDGV